MGSSQCSKWSLALVTSPLEVKNVPGTKAKKSNDSASQEVRPHSCLRSWLHRWPKREAPPEEGENEKVKKGTASAAGKSAPERHATILLPWQAGWPWGS
jgi:hypothetical protein